MFASDGKTLAASSNNVLKLRALDSEMERATLAGHTGWGKGVAISPDGTLASASTDRTVRLWYPGTVRQTAILEGHKHWVTSVAFSPDGKTLASGGGNHYVTRPPAAELKLWDVESLTERVALRGHKSYVNALAFSPDGRLLASAGADKKIILWDAATGKERAALIGHSKLVKTVAFAPTGRQLVSTSNDKTVRLWEAATGRELLNRSGITAAFVEDGKTLIIGNPKGTEFTDVASGQLRSTRRASLGSNPTLSPDGRTLAAINGAVVKILDPVTCQERATLYGHTKRVYGIAFAPGGYTLASASEDTTIKLWECLGPPP
jgi:WD40 repeat protein